MPKLQSQKKFSVFSSRKIEQVLLVVMLIGLLLGAGLLILQDKDLSTEINEPLTLEQAEE